MVMTLMKGGMVALSDPGEQTPPNSIEAVVRWAPAPGLPELELDLCVFAVSELGRVLSDAHFVFYNSPESPDGSVRLEDREPRDVASQRLIVDLRRLPVGCDGLVIAVSGETGDGGSRHFAPETKPTLYLFPGPDDDPTATYLLPLEKPEHGAVTVGAVFRQGDAWKFRAAGTSYPGGLGEVAKDMGVTID
jgi:tellurium resistance protein TerD